MSKRIDCSVLIPVLNEERYIEASVAAMRRQNFDGEIEFLFADGGSTDGTRRILERLAREDDRIRVLSNPGRTVPSGLNVALRHARGRWALRMDAHTAYPENYVCLGLSRLTRGDTRWVSGPPVPKGHGTVSRSVSIALRGRIGRGASRKWSDGGSPSADEFELDTGVFGGVWERATLVEYGGWDERWAVNEDSEMAARFLARGERLICLPGMSAEYVPRDTLRGLWRQYARYGFYRARTARRHPRSLRPSHLLPPAVVVTAAGALVAPRGLKRLARSGHLIYGVALLGTAARTAPAAETLGETALVPLVLLTMHFAHGFGQLIGWIRFGPPLASVAAMCGLRSAPASEAGSDAVYAPSLRGSGVADPEP